MKPAKKIAFCGMITAISLLFFLATGIFPFASYAIPAFCGLLLIPALIEFGTKQALLVFVSVSLLALLLAPDREAAIAYLSLLGYYPIAKVGLEKIPFKPLELLCKSLVCVCAETAVFLLNSLLVGWEAVRSIHYLVYVGIAILMLLIFFVYDWCATLVSQWYIRYLRPRYFHRFF